MATLRVMERTYVVAGMTCAHCARAVEEEVGAAPGVATAAADLASGHLVVTGEAIDDAQVRAAVDEAGYAVA